MRKLIQINLNMILIRYSKYTLILASFFITTIINAANNEQYSKVLFRKIAHDFLLQMNDSTSRILSVEKMDERYVVKFENEFGFNPDLLSASVYKILEQTKTNNRYIIEVEPCDTPKTTYSFEAGLTVNQNDIACKQRALPKACYKLLFTEDVIASQKTDKYSFNYILVLIVELISMGFIFFIVKRRKKTTSIDEINIGKYQFNVKDMKLVFKNESIELSSKETDLLNLLLLNENKTLEKDYILNLIWEDEGNYIGRTLDVFISKLRKKLQHDPNVKIINVRGIGYKLTVTHKK